MVIGVIEREGGTLYCTAAFVSPDGYLGKHRKVMPTAAERLVWGFGDGSTLPVFDTPFGRLGAVICWENYMPLLRMAMYSKGIQIYCIPTADGRETWLSTVRHIALEGRCFVLSANQFTRLSDFPADINNELASRPDDVVCLGGSCIVGPLGDVLAGPDVSEETILFADLGLAWARTVTSGDSSMTLLIATERTGGIWRWSARFSISSSFRSLSIYRILFRRAYLARWIRRSRAVICSMARLACLIIGMSLYLLRLPSLGRLRLLSRSTCNKSFYPSRPVLASRISDRMSPP